MTDRAADFEARAMPHYDRLVRRLAMVVRDAEEAKDLAQATMVRAYESWDRVDREDVGPWLFTIGSRLALNELRRRKRRPWDREAEVSEPGVPAHDLELWAALGDLRREERAALLLHSLGGFSYAEIAGQLETPEGTVASWISRAKGRLREQLNKER